MKKILISAGPIPGNLDSVKYITNRFKGGLTFKMAKELSYDKNFEITIVKWKHLDASTDFAANVINVNNVQEYMDAVLENEYDCFILSAAVANLIPTNPWKGKFPSHNYKAGEKFNIEFMIAPRIIDEVKRKYPRSTLIGYKLFDGTDEELVAAGWETLVGSKANVVFCNKPSTAKKEKIALTPDGSEIKMTFDEHVNFIRRVISLKWFRTEVVDKPTDPARVFASLIRPPTVRKDPYEFGTVALRTKKGFVTTTRGKRNDGYCEVYDVDFKSRVVNANAKATLNAPYLQRLFDVFRDMTVILHGHKQIDEFETFPYHFHGTNEDNTTFKTSNFNIEHHGYYVMFETIHEASEWLEKEYPQTGKNIVRCSRKDTSKNRSLTK